MLTQHKNIILRFYFSHHIYVYNVRVMNTNFDFCKYKHIFGKERQGFHSIRLFDIAVGDVLLTIIGAYIISYVLKTHFFITLLVVLVMGVIVHRIFCVNTKINTLIFGTI